MCGLLIQSLRPGPWILQVYGGDAGKDDRLQTGESFPPVCVEEPPDFLCSGGGQTGTLIGGSFVHVAHVDYRLT